MIKTVIRLSNASHYACQWFKQTSWYVSAKKNLDDDSQQHQILA